MLILKGESCCVQYRSERKGANSLGDWGDPRATQVVFQGREEPSPGKTQAGPTPMPGEGPARGNKPSHPCIGLKRVNTPFTPCATFGLSKVAKIIV